MWHLIAEGNETNQRWRRALLPGGTYRLGRADESELVVPWERNLSRQHAVLKFDGDLLELTRLPQATNPVFVEGMPVETAFLKGGDSFVIGETLFRIADEDPEFASPEQSPLEEVTFTAQQLRQVRFQDADRRLEVLSRLPEVIREAHNDVELNSRLVNLLLAGVRYADAAAVVSVDLQGQVELNHWERRRETAGLFRPSSRLVTTALHRRRTILQVWESRLDPDAVDVQTRRTEFTASAEFDWAFCTPIGGRPQRRLGLYLAGRLERPYSSGNTVSTAGLNLQADMKFAELVAEIIGSVERLRSVEGSLSVLRQFLSPPILAALERAGDGGGLDTDLLEPRECDVTVLFCDVRGFSHRAEESAGNLRGLLTRMSGALEVMTQQILHHGGVTGDFLGDAVLGFWGWPFPSDEAPLNACRAALGIRRAFAATHGLAGHPLADFSVGVGVAHGRAVAGKIGTSDRVTVTVFGPVVNLASRLESMTKQLHVPILLDEPTAATLRERLSPTEGRLRRLGRVLPYGMETPLLVSELLPNAEEFPDLTDEHLKVYEEGVEHFIAGRWEAAYRCLHSIPSSDRAQDFLALRIAQNQRIPPPGWNGVIEMTK